MVYPTYKITHPAFVYVPAAKTDVRLTWRKHGWTPLAEQQKRREIEIVVKTREAV